MNSYKNNGFLVSFLDTKKGFKVKKPNQYTGNTINNIVDRLDIKESSNDTPNLIMVQLESFIDPLRIKDASYKKDPIPVFRELFNKYTSGYVNVPTFGGGTVRSEFEALTGFNIDYLPVGVIPNNDILKKGPILNITQTLHNDGYETTFIHNYTGTFYDRNEIVKNYGFDNFVSKEYMPKPSNMGYSVYPEDTINLESIETLLSRSEDTPQFIYNVTVEGHGAYNLAQTGTDYVLPDGLSDDERNELEDYCMKLAGTDEYIKSLIQLAEKTERPTVIVLFSDHLPSMKIINKKDSSISEDDKYETEFVIWDNLSAEHQKEDLNMELYQLSSYVTERYGFKNDVTTAFHNAYKNSDSYEEALEILQYDMIYGKNYSADENNPLVSTPVRYGLKDIVVEDYIDDGTTVLIKGQNFTYYSKVIQDGKILDIGFIDENTLQLSTAKLKPGNLTVAQVGIVGGNSKIITSSNTIKYEQ